MKRILWVDDEMEYLKPYVLFLKEKNFETIMVNNGLDAVETFKKERFDIVFLDENMPGISGIETLKQMKDIKSFIPIVMITKSEQESIMEEAIGGSIADFLIKPVNPLQILSTIKKHLYQNKLIEEQTNLDYQRNFRQISLDVQYVNDVSGWIEVYQKLVNWELKINQTQDDTVKQILTEQKKEANELFSNFVAKHYEDWIKSPDDNAPLLSHNILKEKMFPNLKPSCFLIVIDNLRYDQWLLIKPLIAPLFKNNEETMFSSILPTATQYARNSIFAGLMPNDISKKHPEYWVSETDESGKNNFEKELFQKQVQRLMGDKKIFYHKVLQLEFGKKMLKKFNEMTRNDINVVVYNFIDLLSHARTDLEVVKELVEGNQSYREITLNWFKHSTLYALIKMIAKANLQLFITTDHGMIQIQKPSKFLSNKDINSNLRYKVGKTMTFNKDDVFCVERPENIGLPVENITDKYVFAKDNSFFVYPNNYHEYIKYYQHTFQHGGISMEEMFIPFSSFS